MEMCHAREHFGLITIATDNTAAITEYTDDSAVLPVGSAVLVRKLQNTQRILDNILRNLEFHISSFFALFSASCLRSDTKLGHGPVSSWSNKGVLCFAIIYLHFS